MQKNIIINKTKKQLIIFTDGSVCGNGRKYAYGGIGVFFPNGDAPNVSEPYFNHLVTNQRTELCAIFYAIGISLSILKNYDEVIIYSDSNYSINCLTKWSRKWKALNWHTVGGDRVQNLDYIKPLVEILELYPKIKFVHVRSHTGKTDYLSLCNEVVDNLATRGTNISKKINQNKTGTLGVKLKSC